MVFHFVVLYLKTNSQKSLHHQLATVQLASVSVYFSFFPLSPSSAPLHNSSRSTGRLPRVMARRCACAKTHSAASPRPLLAQRRSRSIYCAEFKGKQDTRSRWCLLCPLAPYKEMKNRTGNGGISAAGRKIINIMIEAEDLASASPLGAEETKRPLVRVLHGIQWRPVLFHY